MANQANIDEILAKFIPEEHRAYVDRVVYGNKPIQQSIPPSVIQVANSEDFHVGLFRWVGAEREETRAPRVVRFGAIQHQTVLPTNSSVPEQIKAQHERIAKILATANTLGANVICLQEAWTMPFAFCTREKSKWCEFAESAESGPTVRFLQPLAERYGMVLISPILERDEAHGDTVWNTAVLISPTGRVLGKVRKNHIPRVGDFNESTYYMEGNLGHPVFDTPFGRIAVPICYERHHPQSWMLYGLHGAELVFNPSATVDSLSETFWPLEARNAALANNYFTVAINRVGTEVFEHEFTSGDCKPAHKDFGHFYGSSFVSGPDGSRTPMMPRARDALLVVEADLNLCRQWKDKFGFRMTQRLDYYAKALTEASQPNSKPNIIREQS